MLGPHLGNVADEAQRRITLRDPQQPGILTRHAQRHRLRARLAVNGGDQIAIDFADQHHADNFQRLGIGHPQPVAELRLLADPAQHRVDLRPAAMHQHAAHPDRAEQQHVLRQRAVAFGIDCRPAELHHHRLAGEFLDIGQRLDQDLGGAGGCQLALGERGGRCRGGHEVTLFSLM